MWFKKEAVKEQPDYMKLFTDILEALKIAERRLSSLEIELDALKIRLRKKIVSVDEEKKDIYTGNELAI